jgi:hypothetical protein
LSTILFNQGFHIWLFKDCIVNVHLGFWLSFAPDVGRCEAPALGCILIGF